MSGKRRSYDWQMRAIVLFAIAVVILSIFLTAFAIREAEREKLIKQAELTAEMPGIAQRIQDRFKSSIAGFEAAAANSLRFLDRNPDAALLRAVADRIKGDIAAIDSVIFVKSSGETVFPLEHPLYEIDGSLQTPKISELLNRYAPLLADAEAAEYRRKNYAEARRIYRELYNETKDRSLRANLLHCIGRCYLKSGNPLDAVPLYQEAVNSYGDEVTSDGTPMGLLASYQIKTAYSQAGQPEREMSSTLELYKDLLESRWRVSKEKFQTYVNQAKTSFRFLEESASSFPARAELVRQWESLSRAEPERIARTDYLERIAGAVDSLSENMHEEGTTPGAFLHTTFPDEDQPLMISYSVVPGPLWFGMLYKTEDLVGRVLPEALSANVSPHPWMTLIQDKAGNVQAGHTSSSDSVLDAGLSYSRAFDPGLPPWEVHVAMLSPGPAERAFRNKRRLYILIAFVVTAALVGGGTMAIRGTAKELRLAKLKSDFVSTVSHEFRTPLTSIRYLAELLDRDRVRDESQKRRYYRTITRESERLNRLIENILDFSKIEAGMKEYEFSETEVGDLVNETVAGFRGQLEPKDFVIKCEIAKDIPKLAFDKEAVQRALLNLLDNAVKYSGDGRNIRVRAWTDLGGIAISVEDKGIGIAKDEQNKIFAKFYRAGHGNADHIKGSGIGLTLVEHIVRAHRGEVTLDSQLGEGTTVTLKFPFVQSD